MTVTVTRQTIARITAHGLNVYPLEAFGLLLGHGTRKEYKGYALAALPVGKTQRWYEAEGRFSNVADATKFAASLFSESGLRPIGLYCTVFESFGPYPQSLVASAPQTEDAPWLLLRPVDGGESIFASRALRFDAGAWRAETLQVISPKVTTPENNPKRIRIKWNRSYGRLDYGNLHEIELPRLALAKHER